MAGDVDPSRPSPARLTPSSPIRVERSAGGVVIRILDGRPNVLLIRDPYRKWGLPKGHLEEGEGPAEAALREVEEETGLGDLILGPDLGEIRWSFRRRGTLIQKYCRFFLMASSSGGLTPEVEEGISACRWVPGEETLSVISYANARRVVARGLDRLVEDPEPGSLPWNDTDGEGGP